MSDEAAEGEVQITEPDSSGPDPEGDPRPEDPAQDPEPEPEDAGEPEPETSGPRRLDEEAREALIDQCHQANLSRAGTGAALTLYRSRIIQGNPDLEAVRAYADSVAGADLTAIEGIGSKGAAELQDLAEDGDLPVENTGRPACPGCGRAMDTNGTRPTNHPFRMRRYYRCPECGETASEEVRRR